VTDAAAPGSDAGDEFEVDSVEEMQALLATTSDVITVVDETGNIKYQNQAGNDLLGYERGALVGEVAFDYIHPADRAEAVELFTEMVESPGEQSQRIEIRFRHAEGHWLWLESVGTNQRHTALDGYVVTSRDITERKRRETRLEQYETAMETVPDGVFLLDSDGQMLQVNDAWASLVGADADDLIGKSFLTLVDESVINEDTVEAYTNLVSELVSDETDRTRGSFTTRVEPPDDDTEHTYEVHIQLLPAEAGFEGTAGVVRDVTERVEQRRRLERENERLDEFTSIVSHDLRNPLSVLEASLDLMDDVEESHHERCRRAVDRMDRLIDDLLLLARHGDTDADPRQLHLENVARDAWETVVTEDATLVVEDGGHIEADPGQCRQLFENLFRNAIEHGSDTRTVSGTAGEHTDTTDEITVRVGFTKDGFYVADDGSGFTNVDESKLFESGYSSAERGTGFGLKIVEQIADTHDWDIEPGESDAGGARFDVVGLDEA
jgi:PAS domain S-box-containing protein